MILPSTIHWICGRLATVAASIFMTAAVWYLYQKYGPGRRPRP